jgi:hypothetical protein
VHEQRAATAAAWLCFLPLGAVYGRYMQVKCASVSHTAARAAGCVGQVARWRVCDCGFQFQFKKKRKKKQKQKNKFRNRNWRMTKGREQGASVWLLCFRVLFLFCFVLFCFVLFCFVFVFVA